MKAKSITNIVKRELKSLFTAPVGYIVMVIFLLMTGWFYFSTFFLSARADLRDFFSLLPLILAFAVPAVSMKSLAEEYRSGSVEILGTLPLTNMEIVLGKYLGILSFLVIMILPTFSYPLFVSMTGNLDWGPVWGGYLGSFFLAAGFAAVGLFSSSLTDNQIISFIIGIVICFFLTIIDKVLILLPNALGRFLQFLSADYHFQNFSRGVIDSRDIIYFVSLAVIALYAVHLVFQEKR